MIYSPLQISSEMFPVSANVMRLNWLMAFLEGICFLPTSGILQDNRQNRMCQSGKGARKAMNWLCSPVLRQRRIASLSGLCISFTFWDLSSFQSRILLLKSSFFRKLVPF